MIMIKFNQTPLLLEIDLSKEIVAESTRHKGVFEKML